jgi:thiamine-phosphate pyrophosphorylase
VRPLPRVHAFTDGAVLAASDFGIRAAAIAAGGPAIALHARHPGGVIAGLVVSARRLVSLARPPEAAVFISGRADIAAALGAQGVQLGAADLTPIDARRVLPRGWIGRSVHTVEEAGAAVEEGADFLVVGSIYRTASHPDREPAGPELVTRSARLGLPVIAIGGITPERVAELKDAGAYGVAAIRSLWHAADPAGATMAMLSPWLEDR